MPAKGSSGWSFISVDEERITYSGILVGGSIETGRFELKVDDELILGKTSIAAKKELRGITLGAQVEAEVWVTTMTHEEGALEPKTSYVLVSVKSAEQIPTSP